MTADEPTRFGGHERTDSDDHDEHHLHGDLDRPVVTDGGSRVTDGDRDADPYGSTDVTDDVEHHLGGVACALVAMEAFTAPEDPACHKVDTILPSPDTPGGVTLGVYSDGVSGRTILEPEQARALADRLAAAADELELAREEATDE
jgi:hypothetical protein